ASRERHGTAAARGTGRPRGVGPFCLRLRPGQRSDTLPAGTSGMGETNELIERIRRIQEEAAAAVAGAQTAAELEAVRVRYLGRKEGALTAVMRTIASVPAAGRAAVGAG